MNMWGLTPEFIDRLEAGFKGFPRRPQRGGRQERVPPPHRHRRDDPVRRSNTRSSVLETHDKWFGVTYAEDKDVVVNALRALHESGGYPTPLFNR